MQNPIPLPGLRRLPLYLRLLETWRARGLATVSCTHLSQALDLDPTQVRKDLAAAGACGRPKVGYRIEELMATLRQTLGWDNRNEAFLVGAGPLGAALMAYEGLAKRGLVLVGAFDSDPRLVGSTVCGKPVLPLAKLPDLVRRMHLTLGVLATPAAAAPAAAQEMAAAGIRGIWNFTPVSFDLPGVVVEHVDLAQSLVVLSRKLAEREPPKDA